ncbi:UNVERIFIED_CONTAM: hypothetical protein K2H54_043858 [Gekko kuhli]
MCLAPACFFAAARKRHEVRFSWESLPVNLCTSSVKPSCKNAVARLRRQRGQLGGLQALLGGWYRHPA